MPYFVSILCILLREIVLFLFQTIIRGNSGVQINGSNQQGMFGGISVARSNSLRNSSPPARRKYQPDQNYPPLPEDGQMLKGRPQYPGPPPYNRENRDPRGDPYYDQYNRDNGRNINTYQDKNNQMRDNRFPNDPRYPNDRYDGRGDYIDGGRLQPPRDDYRGSHPNSRDQSFEQDRRSETDSYRRHNESYDSNTLRRDPHDMSPPRHNQMPPQGRSPQHPQMSGYPDDRYTPHQQQYPNANGTLSRQPPPQQQRRVCQTFLKFYIAVNV